MMYVLAVQSWGPGFKSYKPSSEEGRDRLDLIGLVKKLQAPGSGETLPQTGGKR